MSAEQDDLELIPRSVRAKLDRIGVKLHLKDWQSFSFVERRHLCDETCESPAEVASYRAGLAELIRRRTGRSPEYLTHPGSNTQ